MKSIFPIRYYASDIHYAVSPELAELVWRRVAAGRTWYAADMEILSKDSIKLFVYDIEDSFSGGIGQKIFETTVKEFTPKEQTVLDNLILERYTKLAADEYKEREDAALKAKILIIRKELFGV